METGNVDAGACLRANANWDSVIDQAARHGFHGFRKVGMRARFLKISRRSKKGKKGKRGKKAFLPLLPFLPFLLLLDPQRISGGKHKDW